jgi:hypothetical protein
MMMPGLVDVHNHHTRGGQLDMFELAFPSSLSFDGILARVRARAAKIAQTEWISGGIWSSELVGRLSQPSARVESAAKWNAQGYPTGYQLEPGHTDSSILAPDDPIQVRAGSRPIAVVQRLCARRALRRRRLP